MQELYASHSDDAHLEYQGNARGRFLVSTAENNDRDDGPALKRPRKDTAQSGARSGPRVTIIDPTALFENVDTHEDPVLASTSVEKGSTRPVASSHSSKHSDIRAQSTKDAATIIESQ